MIFDFKNQFDIERFDKRVEYLKGKESIVKLDEKQKKRTLKQNAYLHSLLQLYAVAYGDRLDKCKQFLKWKCPFMHYEENGIVYLISSADLKTKVMSEWIEWIKNFAGQNGIFLPNADEYNRNWAEYEKEIQACKSYL